MLLSWFYITNIWLQQIIRYLTLVLNSFGNPPNTWIMNILRIEKFQDLGNAPQWALNDLSFAYFFVARGHKYMKYVMAGIPV